MDRHPSSRLKGRGTPRNPANRFETISYQPDPDTPDSAPDLPGPKTRLLRDPSRTILSYNTSPDVGFRVSLNPYRGCEHGCIYCYARPTHEWLGLSAGLDFETTLLVKHDAPQLLDKALAAASWQPQPIFFSGITDAYQPVERRLEMTRGCLKVLAAYRNPVSIVTKSGLVSRDRDLLAQLAEDRAALVCVSLTTLDAEVARRLEPRASTPARRLAAIAALAEAGIPVGVMIAPIIPGLTEHEIPALLTAAAQAGAQFAGHTIVRLPYGVAELFGQWLEDHYPERKKRRLEPDSLNTARKAERCAVEDPDAGGGGAGRVDSWPVCRHEPQSRAGPSLSPAVRRSLSAARSGVSAGACSRPRTEPERIHGAKSTCRLAYTSFALRTSSHGTPGASRSLLCMIRGRA